MFSRFVKPFLLLFGLILLAVPLLLMIKGLEDLAVQEELALESEARQAILAEQEDFTRDLDPARYLQSINDELDVEDGILSEREGTIRQVERHTDPKFFTETFFRRRLETLQQRFKLKPIYFFVTDTDCRNVWWHAEKQLIERHSPVDLLLFGRATAKQNSIGQKPWLPDSVSLMPDSLSSETIHKNVNVIHLNLLDQIFGCYWNRNTLREEVLAGFSERLGSRLFFFSRFLQSAPFLPSSTFGGHGAFYLDASISRTLVLDRALKRSRQAPFVRRSLAWRPDSTPIGFIASGPTLFLQSSFPVEYRSILPPPTAGLHPVMVISTTRKDGDNPYRDAVPLLKLLGALMLFVTSTCGVFWCLTETRLAVSARWKLTGVVSIAVFLPISALGLMTLRLMSLFGREVPGRVLVTTRQQVRSMVSKINEDDNLGALQLTRLKKKAESLSSVPPSEFQTRFQSLMEEATVIDMGAIYRKDGTTGTRDQVRDRDFAKIFLPLSRQILREVAAIPQDSREKEDLLQGEVLDFFWFINRAAVSLTKENMVSRSIFTFSETDRMGFWLLASDTKSADSVWGIGLFRLHTFLRQLPFLMKLSLENPRVFTPPNPYAEIQLGVYQFVRGAGMKAGWPESARFNREMIEIIKDAGYSQHTGFSWRQNRDSKTLRVWEEVPNGSLLVVAIARLHPPPALVTFGSYLLGLMMLFCMLINLLMAELLSFLFIDPIRTLAAGVQLIGTGRLETRVDIPTQDELAEVGMAFNRMAAGIQQRERLRHFVPAKIMQRLASTTGSADSTLKDEMELELIILASDIRGFTSLCERMPPELLVQTLNDYFTSMQEAISGEGGQILKLVGDAILGVFYPDAEGRIPALAAVRAARAMRRNLAILNEKRLTEGSFSLENGIGLAFGKALPVSLGVEGKRQDFTILGPPMAEAIMLESLSSQCRVSRIVIGDSLARHLPDFSSFLPLRSDRTEGISGWEIPEVKS